MKTVRVTIKTETTYDVEFDETIIDEVVINNYQEYIDGEVKDRPDELMWDNDVKNSDYPLLNLSKEIAHNIKNNDNYSMDCLPDIENAIYSGNKNTGIKFKEITSDQEFKFYLDSCKL